MTIHSGTHAGRESNLTPKTAMNHAPQALIRLPAGDFGHKMEFCDRATL